MIILAGVDIGGTKCAVSLGRDEGGSIKLIDKRQFPTPPTPSGAIDLIVRQLVGLISEYDVGTPEAVGISCGGPLDSAAGLVLSPPNLPGWDRIDVCTPIRAHVDAPVALQNDANACALVEWQWGAGRGTRSMVFLTFGTGMGAGIILNGHLYEGASGMAGEVGHLRLDNDGPVGYRKAGSFEGFCSGGGIAQLARSVAESHIRMGQIPSFCPSLEQLPTITAETVGSAANEGDPVALAVWDSVGRHLGRGIAILIDVLNPERIVIGSIYGRQLSILEPIVLEELAREALPEALSACTVSPATLGEKVGDLASLAVARHLLPDSHGSESRFL